MMRAARTADELLAWHTQAMAAREDWQGKNRNYSKVTSEPQVGWYRVESFKRGPWAPARIWVHQVVDEAGELTEPEQLLCEVDGLARDPDETWLWLCKQPIAEREFDHLTRLRRWQRVNAPDELTAPRKVDHLSTPILE